MKSFYFPFLLIIGGNVIYQIAQKSVPKTAHPLVSMMVAYLVSFGICTVCALFYPAEKSILTSLKETNWAVLLIGLGIAGVEIGFLLAYRAGWRISIAPLVSSVGMSLLLIPIGLIFFKEHLSGRNVAGIILCMVGLMLVTQE